MKFVHCHVVNSVIADIHNNISKKEIIVILTE